MSNVGRVFPSEMSSYKDPKSGREILQLTKTGTNVHLYFTENSFCEGEESILYLHREGSVRDGNPANIFRMDLRTGERTQLTDFSVEDRAGRFTKSRDGKIIALIKGGDLYAFFPESGEMRLIARCPVGFALGSLNISHDGRYVAIVADQLPPPEKAVQPKRCAGENYDGFKENFYAHKLGRILIVPIDGSGEFTAFEDTHWLGHVQFAPDTNEFLTYCHEGPWNYVQERIWLLNTVSRRVTPCYRQGENDSLGHEFWTRDGLIFYDNRGRGHDGTITSDKTQAVTMDYDGPEDIPKVGFIDKTGRLLRELELPYYCNHYHANTDNTKLVADAVNDLLLIDISSDTPSLEVLCEHNTSWRYQAVHCHPTFSWTDREILYASDKDEEGKPQLYLIRL